MSVTKSDFACGMIASERNETNRFSIKKRNNRFSERDKTKRFQERSKRRGI